MIDRSDLTAAMRRKAVTLQAELLAKVQANLSGEVLEERSGALKRSVGADLVADDDRIEANLISSGVPYAAIQEDGGRTSPHEILPLKAQALAFTSGAFARRVAHPGSNLPARRYMGSALDSLKPEIADGLKQAVRAALGAA